MLQLNADVILQLVLLNGLICNLLSALLEPSDKALPEALYFLRAFIMAKLSQNQFGRSMVEMIGVLAIIGVLSIAGIAAYSKAMLKFKVNKSLDQISMLVASIQTIYSGQRNYSGLTMKQAISYGIVSPDMQASDSTATNVFAGSVLINEAKYRDENSKAFQIVYNGLGQEACVTMATSDWGKGSSSSLVGMRVADQEMTLSEMDAETYTGTDLPITISEAVTKCTCRQAATCAISWYFQ